MIYRYTILYVADVRTTLEFYRAAFGFDILFLHDSGDYGELQTGGTKLCFSSFALMQQIGKEVATTPPGKPSFELAFETGDVAAGVSRAIAAGAVLVSEVAQMAWGQTLAYVRAPEGTLIEICTPVSPP
ncbi:MAG: VOC family protein [Candidatus Saccharibacteria bacterium]|nr:VOC family protein [Pseudorhodobacter sp.]